MNTLLRSSAALLSMSGMLAGLSWPALAADEPDPLAEVKARTELLQAKTAYQQAATADVAAKVAALGLSSGATGETTVEAGAGAMEGWILSSKTLGRAGRQIAKVVTATAGRPKTIVVLAAEEAFDLTLPKTIKTEIESLNERLDPKDVANCTPVKAAPGIAPKSIAGVLPFIGAGLDLLKTDTKITGYDGPSAARLLVDAVAAQTGSAIDWVVPAEAVKPAGQPFFTGILQIMGKRRQEAVRCRAVLAGSEAAVDKARIAALDASIAAVAAFESRAAEAKDGETLLAKAARLDTLAKLNPWVLRLYIEKSGGSMIVRKNLWTALGAPAVGLTGGAVVDWRLVNPEGGFVKASGVLTCRTALTNMRAIHAGRTRESDCDIPSDAGAGK